MATSPEVDKRFSMCVVCGGMFDLETGLLVKTPTVIVGERKPGDKTHCYCCTLEHAPANGWEV